MKEARSANGFREYVPLIVLGFIALAYYQVLIYLTPTIFWNDSHIRWALRSQLLLGEWLPSVQVFVVLASRITSNMDIVQGIMSLLAIGALVCFYVLARHLFSRATALIAFTFLAFNGMFAAFAITPHPEILYVGFVFLIFILLDEPVFSRKFYFGIFLINMASLTRYEGWFLAVFFVGEVALRSFRTIRWQAALWQTLQMALLCSLAPLAWLMIGMSESQGFMDRLNSIYEFVIAPTAPRVSDHILGRLDPVYIILFSMQFFFLLIRQMHVQFLVLAMVGFSFAILNSSHRSIHRRILLFLIMDWFLLALFQPWKFGNHRQPFLMQVFLVLYASNGLVIAISWVCQRLALSMKKESLIDWARPLVFVSTLLLAGRLIYSTFGFVLETSREARFLIPYKVAKWLEPRLTEENVILIIGDDHHYPYILASYLEFPFEHILDDRFDARSIQENLERVQKVYIIELYESREILTLAEMRILDDLEAGRIQADHFVLDGADVWYAPANAVLYSQ